MHSFIHYVKYLNPEFFKLFFILAVFFTQFLRSIRLFSDILFLVSKTLYGLIIFFLCISYLADNTFILLINLFQLAFYLFNLTGQRILTVFQQIDFIKDIINLIGNLVVFFLPYSKFFLFFKEILPAFLQADFLAGDTILSGINIIFKIILFVIESVYFISKIIITVFCNRYFGVFKLCSKFFIFFSFLCMSFQTVYLAFHFPENVLNPLKVLIRLVKFFKRFFFSRFVF